MKNILLSLILIFAVTASYATVIIVPTDQPSVPTFIAATDTVIVEMGATVDNGGGGGVAVFGTLINFGTFNAAPGAPAIQSGGTIINYGTMTAPGAPDILSGGSLINIGSMMFPGVLIVIPNETFINTSTGVINGMVDANANPLAVNCGTITLPAGTFSTDIPVDTPCDDMDPETMNDVITAQGDCDSCSGELPQPIPTLGEWGLMILGLILLLFGLIAIKQSRFNLA